MLFLWKPIKLEKLFPRLNITSNRLAKIEHRVLTKNFLFNSVGIFKGALTFAVITQDKVFL